MGKVGCGAAYISIMQMLYSAGNEGMESDKIRMKLNSVNLIASKEILYLHFGPFVVTRYKRRVRRHLRRRCKKRN